MPPLTPTTVAEMFVVFGLMLYMGWKYRAQRQNLDVLMVRLTSERNALEVARTAPEPPSGDSIVAQRWRAIKQHRSQQRDGALPESLHLSDAARSQNATEEARFWSGAFVFIGLCGTLLCLGIAVVFLMQTISRGGESGAATNFRTITAHMSATFMSMGLAFVCTIVGTLCTVLLSARIATYERAAEALRLEIERYAFERLEPLALATAAKSREMVIDALVERLEKVSHGFGLTISTALTGLQSLATSTAYSSEKLDAASTNFESAAGAPSSNTQQMNDRLADLKAVFDRQEKAQSGWQTRTVTALDALEGAMRNANETFARLDTLRDDWKTETAATRVLHQSTLDRLVESGSESSAAQKETLESLQATITVGLEELRLREERDDKRFLAFFKKQGTASNAIEARNEEILRDLQRVSNESGQNHLHTLNGIRQEINAGLEKIKVALDESQEHDALRLKQLGETVSHLATYLAHVENTMRQMPAMLGSEPIIAYEKERDETLEAVRATLQVAGKEVSAWREDLKTLLQSSTQRLDKIDEKVAALNNGLGKFANRTVQQDGVLQSVREGVEGLQNKVEAVQTQLQNAPEPRAQGRFGR